MKNLKKIFLIIGVLFLIFIVWGLVFNDGGILKTGYNAIITPVNNTFSKVTGSTNNPLLPQWGSTGVSTGGDLNQQNGGFGTGN